MNPNKAIRILLAIFCLSTAIGCSHYQMGQPNGQDRPRSVHLEPVTNRSSAPQVRVPLAQAIRSQIASNGTFQIAADKDEADQSLQVTITDYQRNIAASQKGDTGRGYSFDVALSCSVTILNQDTGTQEIVEFKATTSALAEPSLPDSEYQVMLQLINNLAQQISQHIAYRWE